VTADGRTSGFHHLLSPGRIGPLALRNRIVMPAMDMNLCDDGVITDGEIAHYRARAAGGTAMVITGSGAVAYPVGAASRRQPGLSEDRFVPGLARLVDAVHGAGGLICVQLCHHGKTARVDIAAERPLLVPSLPQDPQDMTSLRDNTAEELSRLAATTDGRTPTYREADERDIAELIDQFADAARRAKSAGADAVEVHAAHGYVLSTFLAAADNRRQDSWGGSLENRARLTVEVTAAVRAAAGPDVAVLVRLSGREFGEPGALTTAESAIAARMFAGAGADAIHVTGWGRNSFANFTDGPLPEAEGAYRDQAREVKASVPVPVIAVGRVLPELGEEMVARGDCDFVAMGRQLLTDARLVDKLRTGERSRVRPCINCYVCVEQNFFDDPPRCAVNPALGDEALADVAPAPGARHVVVVGGGPGGMEVARLAAERGHRVTLAEATDRLGGTAWFSQLTTPANGPFIVWQEEELRRLGVQIRLGSPVSAGCVRELGPDAVVVATGATRGLPDVPGAQLPHVLSGDSLRGLLTGGVRPAGRASIVMAAARRLRLTTDPSRLRALSRLWMPIEGPVAVLGGGLVGLELAEFLAERGRDVTVLEPGPVLGLPMASPRRWTAVRRARDHGVALVRDAEVTGITRSHVAFRVDGSESVVEASTVVVAGEVSPGRGLAAELAGLGLEVHVVGDAGEVGYIEGAVRSAWTVAAAL
jgi:2,4-dienoyl-CoA reductase-like NADH-dependent reductase (Old Yellow Enzyme family)/NADPH-dependent 2,4-dienoyl-CoA reductase/sulfur reductase-like enzyme